MKRIGDAILRFIFRVLFRSSRKKTIVIHQEKWKPSTRSQGYTRANSRPPEATQQTQLVLKGKCRVIDGDTIVISSTRIRIAGIDAPELDHPWGKNSKFALINMCKGQVVTAAIKETDTHDRVVAKCYLPDGRDLAAELVKLGLALDWPKYSGGEYSRFEPQGIRKKLWRAAARQQGNMKSFNAPIMPKKPVK